MVSSITCRGHGDGVFTESKQTRALSKESSTYVKDTRTSQEAERMSTFQRRRSGARRWHSAAVSSTTWQLLDLSCQSTRTMWSRCTSSSVMKTIATSGVMEAIAPSAFFSTRTRKGSSWEFLRQQERMYDQDGQAEHYDPADCGSQPEVFRGTAEWEYGRYVGAAAQRTTTQIARRPDRLD